MPFKAKVLTAGTQGADICLWAQGDMDGGWEERRFLVIPTGVNADLNDAEYVATAIFLDGLVFHVFEQLGAKKLSDHPEPDA